jgi:hypothetical protein
MLLRKYDMQRAKWVGLTTFYLGRNSVRAGTLLQPASSIKNMSRPTFVVAHIQAVPTPYFAYYTQRRGIVDAYTIPSLA